MLLAAATSPKVAAPAFARDAVRLLNEARAIALILVLVIWVVNLVKSCVERIS